MIEGPYSTSEITINVWSTKLREYAAATGKNMKQALSEEWALLLKKIIDFTPPFKTKGQSPGQTDLSIGRAAVARDIYRTMRPFNPQAIRKAGLQRIVTQKNFAAFNLVASRSHDPRLAGSVGVHFEPFLHLRDRDARGHVADRGYRRTVLGTDAAQLKRYVKATQDRVGYARSGWAKAYYLAASTVGAPPLPAWINRFAGAGGSVIDGRQNENDPSLTAINRSPWAVRKDEWKRIIGDAYVSRATALRSKIATYLRLSKQQAKFAA